MSDLPEDEVALPSEAGAAAPEPERPVTVLPQPVQEHLAQQLRATYQVMADKPAFLGDPVLPPQFDRQIQRLEERERAEIREKAHNLGIEAVEAALLGIDSGTGPETPALEPHSTRRVR